MKAASHKDDVSVLMIADDLTGACDAAAPFASRMQVRVSMNLERVPEAQAVAVNLGTRDADRSVVRQKLKSASDLVAARKPQLLLKKIDSSFRGNTFEEIPLCLELLPHEIAILAPAFPAQGRTVRSGQLWIEDIAGHCVVDLVSGLRQHNVDCHMVDIGSSATIESLKEEILAATNGGTPLLLCNAETQSELDLLALARFGPHVLWFGSAGLSHAFAHASGVPDHGPLRPQPIASGPVVFCIGSNHPVTERQVEYLKRTGDVVEMQPGPASVFEGDGVVLLRMDRGLPVSPESRAWLRSAANRGGSLVLSGGDTAALVCGALEAESIELGGEVRPGIPFGWLRGGAADGLLLVTKSGAFGSEKALMHIAQRLRLETGATVW